MGIRPSTAICNNIEASIWGENLENVAVLGPGVIDGSDAFEPWPGMETSPPPPYGWVLSTLMYQIDDEVFQRGAYPAFALLAASPGIHYLLRVFSLDTSLRVSYSVSA